MMDTKICRKCGEEYPATTEYFHLDRCHIDNLDSWCKECRYTAIYTYRLKSKYNITLNDYNQMFVEQSGCCAICGKHQSELKKRLSVDHNHKTDEVRGLLCDRCNQGLGYFSTDDNVELLEKAIEYINSNTRLLAQNLGEYKWSGTNRLLENPGKDGFSG